MKTNRLRQKSVFSRICGCNKLSPLCMDSTRFRCTQGSEEVDLTAVPQVTLARCHSRAPASTAWWIPSACACFRSRLQRWQSWRGCCALVAVHSCWNTPAVPFPPWGSIRRVFPAVVEAQSIPLHFSNWMQNSAQSIY